MKIPPALTLGCGVTALLGLPAWPQPAAPADAGPVPAFEPVPVPRESAPLPDEVGLRKVRVRAPDGPAADDLRAWLREVGASVVEEDAPDATEIRLAAGADAAACGAEWSDAHPKGLGEEGYLLTVSGRRVRVLANAEAGLFYGVQTLRQRAKASPAGALRGVRIRDYPAQALRGFKGLGPRWQVPEYRDMAEFMARYKMNFLMVCYVSYEESFNRFRDPYPDALMREFRRLADFCRARFVQLCVCINPSYGGGNIRYAGDEDYGRLRDKCLALVAAGIRWVSISLDDIPPDFQYPEDKARFKSFAEAQAFLVNRLLGDLRSKAPDVRIVMCPTHYAGVLEPATPYYVDLRRDLSPDVRLFWTGPGVFSNPFTGDQARAQARTYGRPPFIWDNYPVTDHEPLRKNLGPYTGHSADLAAACSGYMANSMRHVYLSQLPYVTLADYLWNPEAYRPERSIAQSVLHLGGAEAYPALRELVDIYSGPSAPAWDRFDPRREEDLRRAEETARRLERLAPVLGRAMPDGPLRKEVLEYAILNYRRFARLFLAWGACLRVEGAAVAAMRRGAPPAEADPLIREVLAKLEPVEREGRALEALQAKAPPRSTNVWALPEGEDFIAAYRYWQATKDPAAFLRARAEGWLKDPAGRARAARGWDHDAGTLQGGRTWPGLQGRYVYAAGSGADALAASFILDAPLPAGLAIRLTGKDDDGPAPCRIRIAVNGKTIHEGPSGFPDAAWAEKTFDAPAAALVAGENRLEVRNLEPHGDPGMPPWFGVLRVSVEPAPR